METLICFCFCFFPFLFHFANVLSFSSSESGCKRWGQVLTAGFFLPVPQISFDGVSLFLPLLAHGHGVVGSVVEMNMASDQNGLTSFK